MQFAAHSELVGRHAFLSASKHHWLRYDDEKFDRVYSTQMASVHGTRLHDYACSAIKLKIKQARSNKTLNMFINDSIGFRLHPEQPLFYSENAFGTADAIGFRDGILRVFDLKTGVHPGSMWQLKIYAAYFCLEYKYRPSEIRIELRIYQNDDVEICIPEPEEIVEIMEKTVRRDHRIYELELEALE